MGSQQDGMEMEAHVTMSENHWSSQETMKQYIRKIIVPYAERKVEEFRLHSDAKILLVLDVWAVHKSEEFRMFLRMNYPRIHLVFVPPNCTSKLQVADVALQRPFKSFIKNQFDDWAAKTIQSQIKEKKPIGLHEELGMSTLKPMVLQWCMDSWNSLANRKELSQRFDSNWLGNLLHETF